MLVFSTEHAYCIATHRLLFGKHHWRCPAGERRVKILTMKSRFLVNALASLRSGMRFSMRTLLAIMLIAAIFFAWFGWRLRKSQRQTHALAVLSVRGHLCL